METRESATAAQDGEGGGQQKAMGQMGQ